MGELLGDLFTGVSRLALTIVGVYLALHVHQGAQNQFEDET
jgi:hypothetical protein